VRTPAPSNRQINFAASVRSYGLWALISGYSGINGIILRMK
jgi:hypothetical protein